MRSNDFQNAALFNTVSPEQVVPVSHPLRPVRRMVNDVLKKLSPDFARMYSRIGRPSIPPEHLLRALLLQAFYSIRSETLLLEQLEYNLLFRWFVGLAIDDAIWNVSTFSKNRQRFLDGEVSEKFFAEVVKIAYDHDLASDEHFTVDGTLIKAWASHKSFKPKGDDTQPPAGRNPEVDFSGTKRKNDTHASSTDGDARLFKKSDKATSVLGYLGHALMENRHGLAVEAKATLATGHAEREAASELIRKRKRKLPRSKRMTIGADKAYDAANFTSDLRALSVTPHIAQNTSRRSSIDRRTTRHDRYALSQRQRKRVEEIFGWAKERGNIRQVHVRGLALVDDVFRWTLAAYNLVRMRTLLPNY